jgi:hypothetical protein
LNVSTRLKQSAMIAARELLVLLLSANMLSNKDIS